MPVCNFFQANAFSTHITEGRIPDGTTSPVGNRTIEKWKRRRSDPKRIETSPKVSKKLSPTADRMVFYRLNPQEYFFLNVFLRDEKSFLN
jgi:hypothetical protein